MKRRDVVAAYGEQYAKDYDRGWRASNRLDAVAPLEAADARRETAAWYDGYTDAACADGYRGKWHTPTYRALDNRYGRSAW